MDATSEYVESKEDSRRIEIDQKLSSLKMALSYIDNVQSYTDYNRKSILSQIKGLESEKESIDQGQLILS